jgi:hypothetical protein
MNVRFVIFWCFIGGYVFYNDVVNFCFKELFDIEVKQIFNEIGTLVPIILH